MLSRAFKQFVPRTRQPFSCNSIKGLGYNIACQRSLFSEKKEALKDEYGSMDSEGETYYAKNFTTQRGFTFPEVRLRYKTWGKLNEKKDNVMVIAHALTGNANVAGWWGTMLGPGKPFDTDKYLVFCANLLGSCYGTTGPRDLNPETGKRWGLGFPEITVRDSVMLQLECIKEGLGATKIKTAIGGSLGGMQCVEFSLCGRDFVDSIVPMACGGRHHAWQIGISELQRQALVRDKNWNNGDYEEHSMPYDGLSVARQIAMVSYRTHHVYEKRFGRKKTKPPQFDVESYLNYQGKKFLSRFDPLSYYILTKKMDTHDVADGREGSYEEILGSIRQPTLILGFDSDLLYPNVEQEELANLIPVSKIRIIESPEGHDGFLLEQAEVGHEIGLFLAEHGTESV